MKGGGSWCFNNLFPFPFLFVSKMDALARPGQAPAWHDDVQRESSLPEFGVWKPPHTYTQHNFTEVGTPVASLHPNLSHLLPSIGKRAMVAEKGDCGLDGGSPPRRRTAETPDA